MIAHRCQHRITFVLAGIYNMLWGLYAAYDPQWLFRFARLPEQNHPLKVSAYCPYPPGAGAIPTRSTSRVSPRFVTPCGTSAGAQITIPGPVW